MPGVQVFWGFFSCRSTAPTSNDTSATSAVEALGLSGLRVLRSSLRLLYGI